MNSSRPKKKKKPAVEAADFDPQLVLPPDQKDFRLMVALSPVPPPGSNRVTITLQFPSLPAAPMPIDVSAAVDSCADLNFIDYQFLVLNGVKLTKLRHPLPLRMVDSSIAASVTHVVKLPVCFDRFSVELTFAVYKLNTNFPVILGLPWLQQFDPEISFRQGRILSYPRDIRPEDVPFPDASEDFRMPFVPSLRFVSASQFVKDAKEAGGYEVISPRPTVPVDDQPEGLPSQFAEFKDVFEPAEVRGLPPRRPFDHKIELLDKDAPLPYHGLRKNSPAELEALQAYLQRAEAVGEIVRSSSPVRSAVLFAKKKDGSLRVCIDYRAVNKLTKKNRTPLPLISELLDRLSRAKYFACIDLADAYKQVRMAKGSEYLTAFGTRYGSFEYRVMPFGLCNAPATFQALINSTFHDMVDRFVVAYLDDILIFSETYEEHQQNIRKVLQRLRERHLYARLEKCKFLATSVEFLGYIISADGIAMDPKRVATITNWPVPRSAKDIQSFLGFCNFYRHFIRNYSGIAVPLTALTKTDVPFVWSPEAKAAFEKLKHVFSTADILRHCDPRLQYILETDASDFALGAVLSQVFEDGLRPVAFYSKKFTPAELNYTVHNKELLAIVRSFEHWRDYLEGAQHPVRVITDHRPLMYFNTKRDLDRQQARWAESLSRFDYAIEHRPGVKSGKPDALSRRSDYALTPADRTSDRLLHLFSAQLVQLESLSHEAIRLAQQADDDCVARALRLRSEPDASKDAGFSLDPNGLVRRHGRLYVPNSGDLRLRIVEDHHNRPLAGHPGRDRTYELVHRNFSWPGLKRFVTDFVASCTTCAQSKSSRTKPQGLLQPIPPPLRPWQKVTLDFIVSLPESNSFTAICVMVDPLTKMARFEPCTNEVDAPALAEIFVRRIVSQFGVPEIVLSDRGPQFISSFWRSLLARIGAQLRLSTAYRPQTDGQTEIVNGWLGQYLRSYSSYQQDDWADFLPLAEFAYNAAEHASTKVSPFFAMYGFNPCGADDGTSPIPANNDRRLTHADALAHADRMKEITSFVRKEIVLSQELQKKHYDAHRAQAPPLTVGQRVYVDARNIRVLRPSRKLGRKFIGPFPISEVIRRDVYRLKLPKHVRYHPVFHVQRLKPVVPSAIPGRIPDPPEPDVVDGAEEYEVEAVLNSRFRPGTRGPHRPVEYFVKWRGYDEGVDAWQPAENLDHASDAVIDFHNRNPKKPRPAPLP